FNQADPIALRRALLERGRERYDIYCSPCHGMTGDGDGMIVERGFRRPPSYHDDRLREAAAGHFFDVMSNGFGAMAPFASRILPRRSLGHRGLYPCPAAQRARARR